MTLYLFWIIVTIAANMWIYRMGVLTGRKYSDSYWHQQYMNLSNLQISNRRTVKRVRRIEDNGQCE